MKNTIFYLTCIVIVILFLDGCNGKNITSEAENKKVNMAASGEAEISSFLEEIPQTQWRSVDDIFNQFKIEYALCPGWNSSTGNLKLRSTCIREPNFLSNSAPQDCHFELGHSKGISTEVKYSYSGGEITSNTEYLTKVPLNKGKLVGALYGGQRELNDSINFHVVYMVIEKLSKPEKPDWTKLKIPQNDFVAKPKDIIDYHFVYKSGEDVYKSYPIDKNKDNKPPSFGNRICKVDLRE